MENLKNIIYFFLSILLVNSSLYAMQTRKRCYAGLVCTDNKRQKLASELYFHLLPAELRLELAKAVSSQVSELSLDQAIGVMRDLRKVPGFKKIFSDKKAVPFIIEQLACSFRQYAQNGLRVARKLANTNAVHAWICERKQQILLESKFIESTKDISALESYLKQGVGINVQNRIGFTALIKACNLGQVDTVRFLLGQGANPNIQYIYGGTALRYAILVARNHHDKSHRYQILKLLVEHGADPNIQNSSGCTPLISASKQGLYNFVDLLLKNKANPAFRDNDEKCALDYAYDSGRLDIAYLLEEAENELRTA